MQRANRLWWRLLGGHFAVLILQLLTTGLVVTINEFYRPRGDAEFWLMLLVGPVIGLSLTTPIWGYLYALFGQQPQAPDTPCDQAGRFLGIHWFEYDQQPGQRVWTRDPMIIHQALQTQATPEPAFELTFRSHNQRAQDHLKAMKLSLGSLLTFVLGTGAVATMMGLSIGPAVILVGLVIAFYVWMPTATLAAAYFALFLLLNAMLRRYVRWRVPDTIRLEGHLLMADHQRLCLDEPGLRCEPIGLDALGATMQVETAEDTLVVRGGYQNLVALKRRIEQLDNAGVENKQAMRTTLGQLRATVA